MPVRVQTLRSSVKKQRPAQNSREIGELFVNFADLQLGVIDPTKTAVDLVAVRYFSSLTDYVGGDFVFQAGALYRAKGAVAAGAFNAAAWDAIGTAADLALKENTIAPGTTAQYWRGDKSWQTLDKTAVGLANVDNTSDANKPVSTAQSAADALRVLKTGDTMSGHLTLPTGPAAANAVRKDYVDAADAALSGAIGGKLSDAPSDGQPYGRKNAAWVDVAEEAPADGVTYGRKQGAWVPSTGGAAVGDGPPAPPLTQGQLWFEADTGNTYVWYDDGTSQQWVQMNATTNAASGQVVETLVTTSQTWTKQAGLKFLEVEGVGPGGGGAHATLTGAGQYSVGGGGGAGGYGMKVFAAADLPASVVITIGSVGTPGAPGGNSTFGALATVNGGSVGTQSALTSGTASVAGPGGAGGGSSGWTINGTGAPGLISIANMTSGNQSMNGAGGSSPFGGGGLGNFALGRQAGNNATGYGAGGGGANNNPSQGTSSLGGSGSPGFFRLKEIY